MQQSIIKKIYKNNRGYTIVEMFVSITIIGIISGVFFMNYKSADRQFLLDQAAQQVASDLRQAQNYALGQKEFNGALPEGGWGIYFNRVNPNNHYYFLFADSSAGSKDHLYDNTAELYGTGNKKEIFLPEDIVINDNFFDGTPPGKVHATVTFIAPDASVWFCDDVPASGTCPTNDFDGLEVELQDTRTGKTKTITINKYGLIDID